MVDILNLYRFMYIYRSGRYFTIGTISADYRNDIFLDIAHIEVNYREMLHNEQVSGAIRKHFGRSALLPKAALSVATSFTKNPVERLALALLRQEGNQKRMLELVRQMLDKYGIKIDVDDIQITQVEEITEDAIEATESFSLTEGMENDIISALAGYLRDNVTSKIVVTE